MAGRSTPVDRSRVVAGSSVAPMSDLEMLVRLASALAFGLVIGLEREIGEHEAGLRTHLMVTLGACVFALVSIVGAQGSIVGDPTRIASQVAVGIGFIGGGAILREGLTVRGLTTASGLWVSSAVGLAAGFGMLKLTFVATVLALLVMTVFNRFERWVLERLDRKSPSPERKSGPDEPS